MKSLSLTPLLLTVLVSSAIAQTETPTPTATPTPTLTATPTSTPTRTATPSPTPTPTPIPVDPNQFPTLNRLLQDVTINSTAPNTTVPLANTLVRMSSTLTLTNVVSGKNKVTSKSIDLLLNDDVTPITTANFLKYVSKKYYDYEIIHRSASLDHATPPKEIIQGGMYTLTKGYIPSFGNILNEYAQQNVRGTIAMAKVGGDANSANSQWFINVDNNTDTLGAANNGGYTVFGKVFGDMSVVDHIANRPTYAFTSPFNEIPQDQLVMNGQLYYYNTFYFPTVRVVSTFPNKYSLPGYPLTNLYTYAVTSNSNPTLVTAKVSGGKLSLDYKAKTSGVAAIEVVCTSAAGESWTNVFNVRVIEPALAVTVPKSGATLPAMPIVVSGTGADTNNVAVVEYRLIHNGVSGVWQTATNGGGTNITWAGLLTNVIPGANSVEARVRTGSNLSPQVITRNFSYSPPHVVQINFPAGGGKLGSGTKSFVTNLGGKTYTVKVAPINDTYVFKGWQTAAQIQYTNAMEFSYLMPDSNLTFNASFAPNIYNPAVRGTNLLAGSYSGLSFAGTGLDNEYYTVGNFGGWSVNVGKTGAFSGRLNFSDSSISIKGQFTSEGVYLGEVTRLGKKYFFKLLLNTSANPPTVTGQLALTTDPYYFYFPAVTMSGMRDLNNTAAFPAKTPYTAVFAPTYVAPFSSASSGLTNEFIKDGSGWATLSFDKAGKGTLAGMLADGSTLSYPVNLRQDGSWSFYQKLYSGNGIMQGNVTPGDYAHSDMMGDIWWLKFISNVYYPQGIYQTNRLLVSKYTNPGKLTNVFLTNTASEPLSVYFDGGNLASSSSNAATLNLPASIAVTPQPNGLTSLKIDASNGKFSGKFDRVVSYTTNFAVGTPSVTLTPTLTPNAVKSTAFAGVINQRAFNAEGYFLGKDRSGYVYFEPPTRSPSPSPTPTITPTVTLTPTRTLTPTVSPTPSLSPTPTGTLTPTLTSTPTRTPTPTPTP